MSVENAIALDADGVDRKNVYRTYFLVHSLELHLKFQNVNYKFLLKKMKNDA